MTMDRDRRPEWIDHMTEDSVPKYKDDWNTGSVRKYNK